MRKFFTLIVVLLSGIGSVFAQDVSQTLQFCHSDGKTIIADGSIVEVSKVEDFFGEECIKSGVFVKNTSSKPVDFRLRYVPEIKNGAIQLCFPVQCMQIRSNKESFTGVGNFSAFQVGDLQCEWFFAEEGVSSIVIQLQPILNFQQPSLFEDWTGDVQNGPTITIKFNHDNTGGRGINDVSTANRAFNVHTIDGISVRKNATSLAGLSKGLYIVNGKKYIVK